MKIQKVIVRRRGGPDVLELIEDAIAPPGHGEVQVRVLVTGVAFADALMREGLYPAVKIPFTPGADVAGVVEQVGEGVEGLAEGQRVAAFLQTGGAAERINVPADRVVPQPDGNLDPAQVVALILNYLTAYQMMHRVAACHPGDRVLIHGAAGGVGTALMQLGRLRGLTMYGTASAGKHDVVRDHGAVPIDYRAEDFVAVIEGTGAGMDAVFDPIGGGHWRRSFETLRAGGVVVGYGLSAATKNGRRSLPRLLKVFVRSPRYSLFRLMDQGRGLCGYMSFPYNTERPDVYRADLAELMRLLRDGDLDPVIGARFPLEEIRRAHEMLNASGAVGKIVVECTPAVGG